MSIAPGQVSDAFLLLVTHFDAEPEGIALALEGQINTNMVAMLSDCIPAIRVVAKLDSGTEAPRSSIEARIQHGLETQENKVQETYIAWVKGH